MTVPYILPIRDFSDVSDCTHVTQTVHLSLFIYQHVCVTRANLICQIRRIGRLSNLVRFYGT